MATSNVWIKTNPQKFKYSSISRGCLKNCINRLREKVIILNLNNSLKSSCCSFQKISDNLGMKTHYWITGLIRCGQCEVFIKESFSYCEKRKVIDKFENLFELNLIITTWCTRFRHDNVEELCKFCAPKLIWLRWILLNNW